MIVQTNLKHLWTCTNLWLLLLFLSFFSHPPFIFFFFPSLHPFLPLYTPHILPLSLTSLQYESMALFMALPQTTFIMCVGVCGGREMGESMKEEGQEGGSEEKEEGERDRGQGELHIYVHADLKIVSLSFMFFACSSPPHFHSPS